MLKRRAVVSVIASVALALFVGVTFVGTAHAENAEPQCNEFEREGTIEVFCYDTVTKTWKPKNSSSAGAGRRGAPAENPPVCLHTGAVVPCVTEDGIWNGSCYIKAEDPQPPFSDPVWMGRDYGVIVRCTPIPLGENVLGITSPTVYTGYWAPAPPGVTFDPVALARRAVTQMALTTPPIGMAPAPDVDNPNVLITMPAHFWLTGDAPNELGPATVSASDAGLTVTVTATLTGVTFDTGDGGELTCTRAEIAAAPADPTAPPVCGHTWEHPSDDQPGGVYTVTATSHWAITWTGGGQTGTLDMDTDASLDVAVTDLPVHLVTGRG